MLPRIKCERCGHEWIPRVENPRKCPRCGAFRDMNKKVLKHEG